MPKAIIVSDKTMDWLWTHNSHKTACGGVLYFDDYLVVNKAINLTKMKFKDDIHINVINKLKQAIKKYEYEN